MRKPFVGDYKINESNLFGANPDTYKQFLVKQPDGTTAPMRGHNGLDYLTPTHTEVVAPHSGKVIEVSFDANGYGNYIKIENEQEGSVLAHLEFIDVQIGFILKEGDHIGYTDNTGYSMGAHLHWGYYRIPRDRSNGYSGYIDPTPYLLTPEGAVTPVQGQESTPAPVSGKLYTQVEYDAVMADREKFWKERDVANTERDEALKKFKDTNDELVLVKAKLSAFQALGYNTVDDITLAIKEKDDKLEGITKQLTTTLERNATLATLVADKDTEDATAIEMGLRAIKEGKQLYAELQEIKKAAGIKNPMDLFHIVDHIKTLRDLATGAFKKTKQEVAEAEKKIEQPVQREEPAPDIKYTVKWLVDTLFPGTALFGIMVASLSLAHMGNLL